jgi:hypothetical protein
VSQKFATVTGQHFRRSIDWAKTQKNKVNEAIRRSLARITGRKDFTAEERRAAAAMTMTTDELHQRIRDRLKEDGLVATPENWKESMLFHPFSGDRCECRINGELYCSAQAGTLPQGRNIWAEVSFHWKAPVAPPVLSPCLDFKGINKFKGRWEEADE